eukprot:m.259415 g.259415  ORF g.259415 m.259415 type:complete len:433 (-) comp16203_c0_seq6:4197-5495(-)
MWQYSFQPCCLAWAFHMLLTSCYAETVAQECRDRFLEPFSSNSIWNVAIGDGAIFHHAHLFEHQDYRGPPTDFHNDQDFIVRTTVDDPITDWINQGDWGSDQHCAVQHNKNAGKPCSDTTEMLDSCVAKVRLPRNWTSASDCNGPPSSSGDNCQSAAGQSNNNAMALLLPDNETIVQMQPVYRCGFYPTPLLARWGNHTDGGPQRFNNLTNILEDGAHGAHGGSGLSSIGGSIRLGELLPSSPPINHVLKIELANWWYFGAKQLQPKTEDNGGRSQYVWPATGSNAGFDPSTNTSGSYVGTNPYVAPGALLAIPSFLEGNVSVQTAIGARIKDAMVNYGGYLVDGTGRGSAKHNSVALCMDALVNSEMREHFGFNMAYPHGITATSDSKNATLLYQDLLQIFRNLYAVSNNGPSTIGGGGTPRKPPKPPICK